MVIFVNNTPVFIKEKNEKDLEAYNNKFDLKTDIVEYKNLKGTISISNSDFKNILKFIKFAQKNKLNDIQKIVFWVEKMAVIKKSLKKELEVIKAAGGVVKNQKNQILMMKRLGFWDLPKGKADAGETPKITAKREVEEECGVKTVVKSKICTTWHTYLLKGTLVIKQTKWYNMSLISDKKMKPQKEEGIEELIWMDTQQLNDALENSYASINYVIAKFRNQSVMLSAVL